MVFLEKGLPLKFYSRLDLLEKLCFNEALRFSLLMFSRINLLSLKRLSFSSYFGIIGFKIYSFLQQLSYDMLTIPMNARNAKLIKSYPE